jgi:hypothetical protein
MVITVKPQSIIFGIKERGGEGGRGGYNAGK